MKKAIICTFFQSWSDQEVAEGHKRLISQNQLTTQTINRNINNAKQMICLVPFYK